MSEPLFNLIVTGLLPIISGLMYWIYNSMAQRIIALEERVKESPTEQQVRDIISDRLDPVKESLDDIKTRIDKLHDYLLNK